MEKNGNANVNAVYVCVLVHDKQWPKSKYTISQFLILSELRLDKHRGMSTRTGKIFCTVKAEQKLLKLLNIRNGSIRDVTRKEIKSEYLKAVSEIHPDRAKCDDQRKDFHSKFITLQQAWDAYDKGIVKDRTSSKPGTFTSFGVGCSFSDSEEERALRWEIMEQASKGWFPDGSLESGKDQST